MTKPIFNNKEQLDLLQKAIEREDKTAIKEKLTKHPELIDVLELQATSIHGSRTGKDSLLHEIGELNIKLGGGVADRLKDALIQLDGFIVAERLSSSFDYDKLSQDEMLTLLRKEGVLEAALDTLANRGHILTLASFAQELKDLPVNDLHGIVVPELKPFLEEALERVRQEQKSDPISDPITDRLHEDELEILEKHGVSKEKIDSFLHKMIDEAFDLFHGQHFGEIDDELSKEHLEILYKRVPDYLNQEIQELSKLEMTETTPLAEQRESQRNDILERFKEVKAAHPEIQGSLMN